MVLTVVMKIFTRTMGWGRFSGNEGVAIYEVVYVYLLLQILSNITLLRSPQFTQKPSTLAERDFFFAQAPLQKKTGALTIEINAQRACLAHDSRTTLTKRVKEIDTQTVTDWAFPGSAHTHKTV